MNVQSLASFTFFVWVHGTFKVFFTLFWNARLLYGLPVLFRKIFMQFVFKIASKFWVHSSFAVEKPVWILYLPLVWRSRTDIILYSGSFHPLLKALLHFLLTSFKSNEEKCSAKKSTACMTACMKSLGSECKSFHNCRMWGSLSIITLPQLAFSGDLKKHLGGFWIWGSSLYASAFKSLTWPQSNSPRKSWYGLHQHLSMNEVLIYCPHFLQISKHLFHYFPFLDKHYFHSWNPQNKNCSSHHDCKSFN